MCFCPSVRHQKTCQALALCACVKRSEHVAAEIRAKEHDYFAFMGSSRIHVQFGSTCCCNAPEVKKEWKKKSAWTFLVWCTSIQKRLRAAALHIGPGIPFAAYVASHCTIMRPKPLMDTDLICCFFQRRLPLKAARSRICLQTDSPRGLVFIICHSLILEIILSGCSQISLQ